MQEITCSYRGSGTLASFEFVYIGLVLLCFCIRPLSLWNHLDGTVEDLQGLHVEDLQGLKNQVRFLRILLIIFFPLLMVVVLSIPLNVCDVDNTNYLTRIGWLISIVFWFGICYLNKVLKRIVNEIDQRRVNQDDVQLTSVP